jgi:small-conductance mechanosensitive channel/CRP-like cAMP-binding protein
MDPSQHTLQHLAEAAGFAVVALAVLVSFKNRVIRRRMLFTLVVVAALVAYHFAADFKLFGASPSLVTEKLLVSLALINTLVAVLFNPWFSDRVRDRAPAIVQDALVIALFLFVGLVVFQEQAKVFATSAIAAAVFGFALQETLGNAFAGLAIQTEKPFKVGHWISVAGHEGRVIEVTWRATKVRTKAGNLVVLPNNVVAREAINNYTEPTAPTQIFVDVGATYSVPPNEVREALFAAMRRSPYVLGNPRPDVLLTEFAGSAINYRSRFWIDDFENDEIAKDGVRRSIYYEFARRNIEIPWPIQIEYSRQETHETRENRVDRYAAIIARVPVLAALFVEGRRVLAEGAAERLFGDGEVIVREGDPGASMFIVCRGQVAVTIANGHEVARTSAGGYFGEMSLLTGEPRTATVTARGDCTVLEISVDAFKEYVAGHPEVIDHLAGAAAGRRRELDQSRAEAAIASPEARMSLAERMRRFFGLV